LLSLTSTLEPLGLELQDFGEGSVLVKTQPSVLTGTDLRILLTALSKIGRGEGEGERVLDLILRTAAVAACRPLSTFELSERIQDVLEAIPQALEEAGSCFSEAEIEAKMRRFRREED
jgi:DNA mismatch repair ATPase MutL